MVCDLKRYINGSGDVGEAAVPGGAGGRAAAGAAGRHQLVRRAPRAARASAAAMGETLAPQRHASPPALVQN